MLKILRKKGIAKKIIWAIAVVIIISFGFLGTAYLITDQFSDNYAGRIFGRKISLQDYQKAFQQVQTQAIMRYGDNFQQIQQFLDFDNETWDRLILLHEAGRRKISVDNEEVVESIAALPFFMRDGQFDTLIYNDILRFYFRMRPQEFEDAMRDDLRIRKIVESVTADVTINDSDAFAKYKEQKDQVKVQYALIEPESFIKDVPMDDTKGRAIYDANPAAFETSPSINVNYIRFPFPETETPTEPNPDESLETTDAAPSNEKTEAIAALKQKAEAITTDLFNGVSFSETAAKHGVEAQETGLFNGNQPDLTPGWSFNTLNYLFQAEVNESLGPIETDNAFLVVQLKERQDATIPSYEEVRDQVQEQVRKSAALDIASQKAQEYLSQLESLLLENPEMELADVAAQLNLSVQITPAFNRGQYLPKIGISEEFQNASFALSENDRLGKTIISTPAGPAILYLAEVIPASQEQFESDKDAFVKTLLAEKTNQIFSDYLTELRAEAKLQDNVAKLRQRQTDQSAPSE